MTPSLQDTQREKEHSPGVTPVRQEDHGFQCLVIYISRDTAYYLSAHPGSLHFLSRYTATFMSLMSFQIECFIPVHTIEL
jgi:hypothetical protein